MRTRYEGYVKGPKEIPTHVIQADRPVPENLPPAVGSGWAWEGKEIDPEDPECLAKIITDNSGKQKWFAKSCVEGPEVGALFSPNSMFSTPGMIKKHLKQQGRNLYVWKEVTQERFDHYMRFLQTGLNVHLHQAGRN